MKLNKTNLLAIAALTLGAPALHAADGIWDTNSAGNWTDFTNWQGDLAYAEGADSTATFGNFINADRIITLDAPITIGNVTASDTSHNYTISGANTLTLERTDSTRPTIDVTTTSRILTISSVIAGNNGLKKNGAGTLILTGTNSFTGGLEIDAGTVRAEGGGNSFGATGSTITIDGGQIHGRNTQVHQQGILLNQTKTSFVKGNGGTWEFTGAVSGAGGLAVNDAGSVFQRTLTFSSTANTFEGVIDQTPNKSTFQVNSLADSVTAIGNILFDESEAYFGMGPGTAVPITLNNRRVELTGTTGGTNRIGNANTNVSNILTINTDLLATKTGLAAATRTLQFEGANTGNNAFNGDIANGTFDTLNVTKAGNGKWILSGDNTYIGTTTLTAGTLLINNTAGSGTGSGPVVVNAGTLGGTGSLSGAVTIGNGTGSADAILAPGASIESLATGNLTFASDGSYAVEVDATSVTSDQTLVTGTVTINAATTLTVNLTGTLAGGQKYFIVVNDDVDAVAGTFKDFGQGAIVGNFGGVDLKISYTGDSGTSSLTGGNDIVLYVDSSGGTPFETWAATGTLPGTVTFDGDLNGDGVQDGLAFLLGAVNPDDNAVGLLPKVTQSGGDLVITFATLTAANRGTAVVNLQHSSDLGLSDPWFTVTVPETTSTVDGVSFNVILLPTPDGFMNGITATIPASEAAAGKLFGRLVAEQP